MSTLYDNWQHSDKILLQSIESQCVARPLLCDNVPESAAAPPVDLSSGVTAVLIDVNGGTVQRLIL
jgi:hypothetical protein